MDRSVPPSPPAAIIEDVVRRALAEDIGRGGDLTTEATIAADHRSMATLVSRQPGTIAGLAAATSVFALIDDAVEVRPEVADGDRVAAGAVLARVEGPTRAILTGERTCLNLLGRLSGVATATADLVRLVAGTKARIVDTRKTTPGLRTLEKYAVRCGGGANHRFGLDDAVLIKDNHIAAAGSIADAVTAARSHIGHMVKVEVEVDTLDQLDVVLGLGVDAVLLDNMDPETLAEAVRRIGGRCVAEASGTVTADTVRAVAETGVDLISVGWITHSAPQLDIGLDL